MIQEQRRHRFLIDDSCPRLLVARLRELGFEVDEAVDLDRTATDEVWAAWATERGQVIVSLDRDFIGLAEAGQTPFGVVRVAELRGSPEARVERIASALLTVERFSGAITTVDVQWVRQDWLTEPPPRGDHWRPINFDALFEELEAKHGPDWIDKAFP